MTKQNQAITVNRLPAKTWNWLKMNETVIGMPRIDGSIAIKQSVAEAGQAEDEQLRMAQQTDWDKIGTCRLRRTVCVPFFLPKRAARL